MRWGGLQLRVGDWVRHAAGMTCMALSAHEMTVSNALASLTSLAHLELSTVSGGALVTVVCESVLHGAWQLAAAAGVLQCGNTGRQPTWRQPAPAPNLCPAADMGPMLLPGSLPSNITRLCIVPAPVRFPPALPPDVNGIMPAELPEQLLALPLVYLDVSESLFSGAHLAAALPRLTRLTSLALDKCELTGASLPGK